MPHLPWEMMRPAYNLNPRIEVTREQCLALHFRDSSVIEMGPVYRGVGVRQESMGNPWVQASVSL
jgi:hypothetical protein